MTDNTIVIETLNEKKAKLQSEKESAIAIFDRKIQAIDAAIKGFLNNEHLEGSTIGDVYNDESPDYIKSSPEEM